MIILYVVFSFFFFSSKKFIVTNVTGLKAQVLLDYILLVLVVIVYFLNSYFSVYYYIQFFEFKVSIFSIHDLFLPNLFFKTANLSVQLFYTKRFFFFSFPFSLSIEIYDTINIMFYRKVFILLHIILTFIFMF